MSRLSTIEKERNIVLPEIYKDFYGLCSWGIPKQLVGTDLFNHYKELQAWAFEIIEENGIDNFLEDKDFVFMMHQGYVFWYFKADGDPDPDVFSYTEVETQPKNLGPLSTFINQYIN